MNKKLQLSEVLDLKGVEEHCKEVIKHCDICNGVIIDDDNVPDEFIVDYNDRRIYSAMYTCCKCGAEICENCAVTIDGNWEKLYICSDCYAKRPKLVDKIQKLQKRISGLSDEIDDLIEEFLND